MSPAGGVARERGFAHALLDAAAATPEGLIGRDGAAPVRRFAVYRNNVTVGLIDALATRFPVVRAIVGEACFTGLARGYARANPPRSPLMHLYGASFPTFLAEAVGLEELDYLPDVSRLESARVHAYHAADATPLDVSAFAALDPGVLGDLRLSLHPSLTLVRSHHPVATIWAMNAGAIPLEPIGDWRGEDVAVVRPRLEVEVLPLSPGAATFLDALDRGVAFADAAVEGVEATGGPVPHDALVGLARLVQAGLVVGLTQGVTP
ncbi:DUF2063 domain-containing protein [Methylopila jiangsuensis]|uniref:DUF2063 domain-containing protein n=1 Tax=Methylopila jiangsuensis TaxID=586230 RepID=A0A9W6N543_9HYPH|nr:DNA-binding domain-containing protein [Methylopila jiangsuensis]MDR6284763.1 hypothetical protein [Methylopila jiangsuensis]GLK77847.1 DUF2063 domain-containing protein [Methylopila jiangsuensis]